MNALNYSLDVVFLVIAIATTRLVAGRMMIESGLLFLAILLSSLVSMSLFEPVGEFCLDYMFSKTDIAVSRYLWFFFAWAIFVFCLGVLLQWFFSTLDPVPQFSSKIESVGRWGFGGLAGYTLAAFLLTTVHTLPGPRDFWGLLEQDARLRPGPIMFLAPDYHYIWLADCVLSERGFLSEAPNVDEQKLTNQNSKATLVSKRIAWFPIRYANWRENLESYDADLAGDSESDDEYLLDFPTTSGAPENADANPDFDPEPE